MGAWALGVRDRSHQPTSANRERPVDSNPLNSGVAIILPTKLKGIDLTPPELKGIESNPLELSKIH